MDYKLLKDLPGHKAGKVLETDDDGLIKIGVSQYKHIDKLTTITIYHNYIDPEKYPDFFERVEERVTLARGYGNLVFRERGKFTDKEVEKMEAALNGKIWTEDDVRWAIDEFNCDVPVSEVVLGNHVNRIIEILKERS